MVSLYEYDQTAHMKLIKEESYQDGFEDGTKSGIEQNKSQMQQLFDLLISENRLEDLQRACRDTEYLNELLNEYHLTK